MKNWLKLSLLPLSILAANAFAEPVEFQKIPQIMAKFENPQLFVKKARTLGRLAEANEIGKPFDTYVSDGKGGYTLETSNTMSDDVVVASMPEPIAGEVYNQWLVPKSKWVENYGKLPESTKFESFRRVKTIKAIKIDDEMLKLLESTDGKTAIIKVSWDKNGMTVYKDGYLANYEYGIAPEEMKANYELVK
ncbi:hypothetical protein [Vibrio sp. SCSIO 43137]|uniref:hypothetical protein n=1 Tax=Vibrio sp. SCSIO 43137 TaxID=3021011 RepID=UPI002307F7B1|nr:hypothetical protein [Vibrio sp. SCSIO 43137]WCE28322.1 hypothetical protein PK654_07980 [Vibrio sp. SCSIO 43137]